MSIVPGRKGGKTKTAKPDGKDAKQDSKKADDSAKDQQKGKGKGKGKAGQATAANTPATFYFDTKNVKKACAKEKQDVTDKCKADSKKNDGNAAPTSKFGALTEKIKKGVGELDGAAKKAYGYTDATRHKDNAWLEDHCKGLWVKPAGRNIGDFNAEVDKLKSALQKDIADTVKNAGGQILDKAAEAGKNYAERAGTKELGALATAEIPVVGEIVVGGMTLYNIVDGVWTAGKTAYEVGSKAYDIYQKIGPMKDELGKLADVLSKKTSPTDLWADAMTGMAYPNPCLQAKRCQLVPFSATKAAQAARSGKGCCPGQTGHHLLPAEMFEECKSYTEAKHNGAPNVCVEGTNNTQGSHGLIHGQLEEQMRDWRNKNGDQISLEDAINEAVKSHRTIFKPSCSEECLRAQLKAYYKTLCKNKMKPRGGKGTDIEESSGGAVNAPTI